MHVSHLKYDSNGDAAPDISLCHPAVCAQTAQATSASNVTLVDVPGLSFWLKNGQRYYFRFMIPYRTAATTTGLTLALASPAVTSFLGTVAMKQGGAGTDMWFDSHTTTPTAALTSAAVTAADANFLAIYEGVIEPSADGALQLQFRSEVNGSLVTVPNGGIGLLFRAS